MTTRSFVDVNTGATKQLKALGGGLFAEVTSTGMSQSAQSGTLAASTFVLAASGLGMPCSITFKSSDATRKIELSPDGGTEYFQPVYDYSGASMLVVVVTAPISHIKFTGAVADAWRVQ
jgi:hypothetical protein